MNITRRLASIAPALALAFVACSSNDPAAPKTCPPCAAGTTCDWQTGACVPAPACTPGQACGMNADCSSAGSCACRASFSDCNGDLGQATGNGCECDQACNGAVCGAPSGQCSAEVPHACNSFSAYCAAADSSCQACPAGSFNCDGIGPCESQQACSGAPPCSPTLKGSCAGDGFFCDGAASACAACAPGTFNCDGTGICESQQACASVTSCVVNYQDGCGGDNDFCDAADKTCKPCPAGSFNCDGTGICECDFQCAGDICEDLSKMSCADLEIAYGNLVGEAMACDIAISAPQCTEKVPGGAKCRCDIFANANKGDALRKMEKIIQTFDAMSCPQGCPPVAQCTNPTSSACKEISGKARCY